MASPYDSMESSRCNAYSNIKEAAKDFSQFGKFPAEVKFMIFEQAAIIAAEELHDMYAFDLNVCKDEEANGSEGTVATFTPCSQLTRVCKAVRCLMQACRTALKAVNNVFGGELRVKSMKMRNDDHQLSQECIPFDFERSTFCVNVDPSELEWAMDRSGEQPAFTTQPATHGFEFAPQVKNLKLIVAPYCTRFQAFRSDLSTLIERFPIVTNCTLISSPFWDTEIQAGEILKSTSHYSEKTKGLRNSSEQTIQEGTLEIAGVMDHVMDWLYAKQFNMEFGICWISATIRLQRTAMEDGSSRLDSASCDYLYINPQSLVMG